MSAVSPQKQESGPSQRGAARRCWQEPRELQSAMADMDYTDTGDEVEILVGEPEIRGFVFDNSGDENVEDNRIKPVKREAGRSVVSEVVDGVLKGMETLAVQSVDLHDEAGCRELLR